jgi:hypothetical protein
MRGTALALWLLATSCGDGVSIMKIQGDGPRSPLEGQIVATTGVVTALRADGRGFWIQDPDGDAKLETSDGILIWTERRAAPGERVRVEGVVAEFEREGGLSLTQIVDVETLEVLSSGHDLPPLPLPPVPDSSIADAIRHWARLEGMLVALDSALVVGPTTRFGEVVVVQHEQAGEGNHVFVRALGDGDVDYNPERIVIDDAIAAAPEARPGDVIRALVGVVDYSFGNYKLQARQLVHVVGARTQERPRAPGGLAVASFNVENLFEAPGEALESKLDELTRFIMQALLVPEILVVQEVENEVVLRALGERINTAAGTRYRARGLGSSDGRGIENAFLYDAARVRLNDAFLLSGADVEAAFGPNSVSPGREPLVGKFEIGGAELVIVGNHFKSKGGDDPLFGARQPFQRPTERQRKAQARAVRRYVDELLAEDPGHLILVAGDLNDFPFSEPGEGSDHPLGILEGEDDSLTNLVAALPSPYTFVFEGNAQVLDHLLVSASLGELVLGAEIVHGNADDPTRASDHDPPVVRLRLP